jgi:glycine betaine/choline ABC-type transport system substrate-binding protein
VTLLLVAAASCGRGDAVVVGSKNFTESVILGELVAQQLERHGIAVDRRLNLGGTFICHEAIRQGQIDVYVEYTGTAYGAILELPVETDRNVVLQTVDSVYRSRWRLRLAEPLGFNNTFAMLVRAADARELGLTAISDAAVHASDWRAGFGYEFMERADGYAGLVAVYGLRFGQQPVVMDLGLTYRALAESRVDIIAGNSTDGQIEALDLYHLEDDLGYFPPYEAVPIVSAALYENHPDAVRSIGELGGTIDETSMRWLNAQVDVQKRDVQAVIAAFLDSLPGVPGNAR